ncbi:MAG: hypothetical protein KAJ75_05940 [Alphaproteobacteria bacterium]|nr:hypothetical protein [Alphaproteobacteria bacterium]
MNNDNADKNVIVTDMPAGTLSDMPSGTLSDEKAGIASDKSMGASTDEGIGIVTDEGIGTVTDDKVGKVEEAKFYNDEEAKPEKPRGQHHDIRMQDICEALFEMGLTAATNKWSDWMARLEVEFDKMDSGSEKTGSSKDPIHGKIDIPELPTEKNAVRNADVPEKNAVRNVDVSEMTLEEAQIRKAEITKEGVENKKAIDGAGEIVGQSRNEQKGLKPELTAEILKKNKGQRM